MFVSLGNMPRSITGVAIGHCSPASYFGNLSPHQAQQLFAYARIPADERLRRALLGQPTSGPLPSSLIVRTPEQPKKPGEWTDEDRRQQLARLQQRDDDNLRRELCAKLKQSQARIQKKQDEKRRETFWAIKADSDRKLPKIDRPKADIYTTAVHEAAHALFYVLHDYPCAYATVVPRKLDKSLGHVEWGHEIPPDAARLEIYIGGPLAQEFWTGIPWIPELETSGDVLGILEICELDSDCFRDARQRVGATVKKHWRVVCKIADALVEHHTILGDEITAMIKNHLEPKR